MTPSQFEEAKRLHDAGFKLCELLRGSKQPVGDGWNNAPVTRVHEGAGGYGLILAMNGLCSVDVDTEDRCVEGLARCGFDLQAIRASGIHTSSTRPKSGGRVTFRLPPGSPARWLKFTSRDKAVGTILELRAESPNLQDSLPGTTYHSKDGSGPWVQEYAGPFTMEFADVPPPDLLAWWERMSVDVDFYRHQQALFVGADAQLAISSGDGKLAYTSSFRASFNERNRVEDILLAHDYTLHRNGRYAPATATGAVAVRPIPGKDDLWQSDHQSDPLTGTFDAWSAHVVLVHDGDLAAAEASESTQYAMVAADGFEDVPVVMQEPGAQRVGNSEPVEEDWPAFDRDKTGKVKPIVLNLVKALRRPDVCGVRIGLDRFRDEIMLPAAHVRAAQGLHQIEHDGFDTPLRVPVEGGPVFFHRLGVAHALRARLAHDHRLGVAHALRARLAHDHRLVIEAVSGHQRVLRALCGLSGSHVTAVHQYDVRRPGVERTHERVRGVIGLPEVILAWDATHRRRTAGCLWRVAAIALKRVVVLDQDVLDVVARVERGAER